MPSDNFTMSENSGSFGMQQRQDRFAAIGDLIVGPPGPPGPPGEDAPDDYILVQTTQPTSETNAIWVDPSDQTEVVLATWADVIGLYPTNTASGDVAHFEDGANNIPIKRLTVNVEPIQDLHGYDSPWPAGGGKNLIPTTLEQLKAANTSGTWADNVYSINDLTFTVNADGTITVNGTSSADVYFNFRRYQDGLTIPAGDYVLHKSGNDNINVSAGKNNTYWGAATTSDVSLTLDSDATFSAYSYVANGKTLTNFVLKPMLESGTTASAWQPYSNICPISGWSEAQIWNDPKYAGTIEWNQAFLPASDWIANTVQTRFSVSDGVITATLVSGKPNVYAPAITTEGSTIITTIAYHKYYLACKFNPAADGYPYLRNSTAFSTAAVFGSQTTRAGEWGSYENIVSARATGGPAWYIGNGGNTSQIQIGDSFSIKDLMCIDLTAMFGAGNEPSTVEEFKTLFPNDYYAYNAGEETLVSAVNGDPYREVTIDLDGTRYGGTVDVLTGKMVVDRALRVFNGSENGWQNYPNFSGYYITITEMAVSTRASGISNMLVARYDSAQATNAMWLGVANRIFFAIGVYESMGSTLADFKSFLSANNLQVVFPLATPIEITLTPTQIETLLGTNNIWSDAGSVDVEYRADIGLFIQQKIAELNGG